MTISDFRGPYRWLSNFHLAAVVYDGHTYPSTEHAYQAAKALDIQQRIKFMTSLEQCALDDSLLSLEAYTVMTCAEAKRAGQKLPLRAEWEEIKLDVMRNVLYDKFQRHEDLKQKLLATGDEELVEGNTWGDRFWGVCNGVGENHLGKLLMELRAVLREGQ